MDYAIQVKIMGDPYNIGFANGLTMCETPSVWGFQKAEESEAATVYRDERGYEIVQRRTSRGNAVEVTTEFINKSEKPVTLEMLASFALKNVKADKIHRLQSF